jgi:MOB kinase activator 1
MEGYLEKLSSGLVKRWQKRYFVMTGHYLNYSENEQDAQTGNGVKSSIDLVSATSVEVSEKITEFTLNLGAESFRFKAEGEDEAERWVASLETFIAGAASTPALNIPAAIPEQTESSAESSAESSTERTGNSAPVVKEAAEVEASCATDITRVGSVTAQQSEVEAPAVTEPKKGGGRKNTGRRPKPHGTLTRNSLHKQAMARLKNGHGSLEEAVKAPVGQQLNEWHAVNVTNFYNDISMLFGVLEGELCTSARPQCASMTAGPHQYLWADGVKIKKPVKCTAAEYMDYLLHWTEDQLDSDLFPTEPSMPFPENFVSQVRTIFKRLFRAYAHMYHSHFDHFVALGAETHLNTCFKHFIVYVHEHALMEKQDQEPLKDFIPKLLDGL